MIKVDVYLHTCTDEDGETTTQWGTESIMVADVLRSGPGVSLEDFKLIAECLERENEFDTREYPPEQWYRLSMRMEDTEVEHYPGRFRREWYYHIMATELVEDPETQVCEELKELPF